METAEKNNFLLRAEAELDLAQQAPHERAVHAHHTLANLYLEQVYQGAGPNFLGREALDAEHG